MCVTVWAGGGGGGECKATRSVKAQHMQHLGVWARGGCETGTFPLITGGARFKAKPVCSLRYTFENISGSI